jgi:cytochrome c oxidase cbb3-type subunit 3
MRNQPKHLILTTFLLTATRGLVSAAETPDISPAYTNPVFLAMLMAILILFFVIIGLAATIRNLAEAARQKINTKSSAGITPLIIAALTFIGAGDMLAQDTPVVQAAAENTWMPPASIGGLDSWVFLAMLLMLLAEVLIVYGLLRSVRQLLVGLGYKTDLTGEFTLINWKRLNKKLTDAVPIEEEGVVMTDHEYDGIRELDNNLPPWWKYGFYLTIVFSLVYLISYHVTRSSPLQLKEYQTELAEAEASKASQLKSVAASVDENTVTTLTDPAIIASGMEIFKGNCASCHGQSGEGGVGPNLTDEFWINGGGINNIFKVIKYGVPAKGMISWQQALKPEAIQKVASYIVTLAGTKPANAKAPQGEIWKAPADSSVAAESAEVAQTAIK